MYYLGQSPSNATLEDYTISLLENSYSNLTISGAGFTVDDLMHSTYDLGTSPNATQTWSLACEFISNATQSTFSQAPLFTINATSLSSLLSELSPNSTVTDVNLAINNVINTEPYTSYPYIPSTALSGNFVNSQNNTMLIIFGFSSNPDQNTIARVESDVSEFWLTRLGISLCNWWISFD